MTIAKLAALLVFLPSLAFAQGIGGVQQSGVATAGHCAQWTGNYVLQDSGSACGGGGGSSSIAIGTTTVTGGTTTRVLFDNAGVAGEYTISGTGSVCMTTNCVLTTPNLGTPSAAVLTNATGTASGLTAGNVTTNANLTGVITSVGNATSIASQTGTGTKFVVDTNATLITPTFTTSATTPLIIGGTTASSSLTEESTSGAGTTDFWRVLTGSQVEAMRINTSGNVGIGTATFTNKFNIYGNAAIGTSYPNIAAPTNGLIVQGNVGIGSSATSAPLDIQATDNTTFMRFVSKSAPNFAATWNYNVNGGFPQLTLGGNVTYLFDTATASLVGSASALPGSTFNVNGGESVGSTYFQTNAGTNNLIVQGTIGVGTTVPQNSTALHVIGTQELGQVGSALGKLLFAGNTSGLITEQPQAAAGTYNFNLPTTAGTSGQFLTSGGGSSTAMSWSTGVTGSGGTPTCGAGCSAVTAGSTDIRGSVTGGTAVSSIVVNFSATLASAPFCTVTGSSALSAYGASATSSALTVSLGTALTADVITYICAL